MLFAKAIQCEPKVVRIFCVWNTNRFKSVTNYGKGIDKKATKSLYIAIFAQNTEKITFGMHIAKYLT